MASLFSGGKDSVFSMYLALQSGFEVPYLVSIKPVNDESWIFHVPNIDMIPVLADVTERIHIKGFTDGTEEGDLIGLKKALENLDIDGIVMGAVWSDYQMDRMNRVCEDLGLKVFAPLWRKDQNMLLREILESGIEAVIVGYYAEGFGPEWLGRKIDWEAFEDLEELNKRFGVSITGEGGEYETIVLNSPIHKHPLKITSFENTVGRNSGTMKLLSLEQDFRA